MCSQVLLTALFVSESVFFSIMFLPSALSCLKTHNRKVYRALLLHRLVSLNEANMTTFANQVSFKCFFYSLHAQAYTGFNVLPGCLSCTYKTKNFLVWQGTAQLREAPREHREANFILENKSTSSQRIKLLESFTIHLDPLAQNLIKVWKVWLSKNKAI